MKKKKKKKNIMNNYIYKIQDNLEEFLTWMNKNFNNPMRINSDAQR
jgi:hypothetical protein